MADNHALPRHQFDDVEQQQEVANLGMWVNGMKLASELLRYQRLTQFLPGCDHEREALGSPLLDPWFHAMRADGVDDQRS